MYQMVRLTVAEPSESGPRQPESARDRLLAAAVAIAMQGGIADLSLRELAAAIGTSHRTADSSTRPADGCERLAHRVGKSGLRR
jgi:hypothetical protein